jgi:hypothetical protein
MAEGSKIFLYLNQILKISPTDFILYASVSTEILPVIFYLILHPQKKDESLRVIFFLLLVNFSTDVYGIYSLVKVQNNSISFNLNLLIETICLCIFYTKIIREDLVKKIIYAVLFIFLVFWGFQFGELGKTEFLWDSVTFENILVMVFAIYYYYEQIFKLNTPFIYRRSRFWVVTAYFITAAGTFFLLLYIRSFNPKVQQLIYVLNYIFVIIRTILLCIAMFSKDNNILQKQKYNLN